ncbi:alanine racemase [Citricoccus sp. NR2]|uniref:alanine racemase n=1 Tax=Citricoccus sp. NR2 TaxID=3004095 RepID=UPI0022DDB494|nr:alanine racemase [Citricoccus sp. NR2]WBL17781.1 alanine racemase [Citricoccus sp. NR2]
MSAETSSSSSPTSASHGPAERAAVIDHAALAHNVNTVRSWAQPAQVMAVVKADAYGHGMIECARTAVAAGATWLGVAHVSEALQLREAGLTTPTLAWLHTTGTPFGRAVEEGIDLGVSGWELDAIAEAARRLERPARVHLKIDTGLGRNGCPPEDWDALCARAAELQRPGLIRVVGVFSHLAVADEPEREHEVDAALNRFHDAVALARSHGLDPDLRHLANTPATLARPDTHLDMVRFGVGMYGLSPFAGEGPETFNLRPVMSLTTTLAANKLVPANQGVSYGYRYRTGAATRLGLVPLGYADGVPRTADEAPVWIDGRTYRVSGRIAMDQFMVDLHTEEQEIQVGAPVELFGPRSGILASDWADAAGTINYEIVTRVGARVPRIHVNREAARRGAEEKK